MMNTIDLTVAGDDEHHAAELTIIRIDCNEAYITSVSLVLYISVGFSLVAYISVGFACFAR